MLVTQMTSNLKPNCVELRLMATANLNRCGIYRITCTANNRFYVGSAKNIRLRWKLHRTHLRMGIHHNKPLQKAWDKYEEKCFVFDTLEFCSLDDVIQCEQKWLDKLMPYKRGVGFNVLSTAYSSVGLKHSDKTLEKLREIAQSRSPEHYEKIARANRGKVAHNKGMPGKKWTDERREAHIARVTGKPTWNKGLAHPEEVKKRISASLMLKMKVIPDETRSRIKQLRLDGNSYPEISRLTGVSISQCHKIVNDIHGRNYRRAA